MIKSQQVTVDTLHGIRTLVVVEDLGDIVALSPVDEVEAARMAGRTPITVGFRKADIVGFDVDPSVRTKHNDQYEPVATGEADRGRLGAR